MRIKIYSTPVCPYCHLLKDYLRSKEIAFEDINVASDQAAAREMVSKSGQMGVPVSLIITDQGREEVVVGFDKERLNAILGLS